MNARQAKKIVKAQAVECRFHIGKPIVICTAGRSHYTEGQYRRALIIHLRKLDQKWAEERSKWSASLASKMRGNG